jgi:hypothetical protein
MRMVEIPFLALQRLVGINRLAWVFLLPNLLLFGLFAFLPIILNVFYAMTGGDNVLLDDRPFVGGRISSRSPIARTFSTPIPACRTSSGARSGTRPGSSRCRSASWSASRC